MRREWSWVLPLGLAVGLLVWGSRFVWVEVDAFQAGQTLEREYARAKELGLPLTPDELAAPVPDQVNGAVGLVDRLDEWSRRRRPSRNIAPESEFHRRFAEDRPAALAALDDPFLDDLRTRLERPSFQFPHDPVRDILSPRPEIAAMREAIRAAAWRAVE
ncbi:MAG: hypothetical protein MH204_11155 [Fimbriimonadaceae bacterium]|nr:hypothetical protein [Fimbriimonadaceae bacterium]